MQQHYVVALVQGTVEDLNRDFVRTPGMTVIEVDETTYDFLYNSLIEQAAAERRAGTCSGSAILAVCKRQGAMRPEVLAFAHAMEDTLQKHDAEKGACGWSVESPYYLLRRMDEEKRELSMAVKSLSFRGIQAEAVDVANFAMMIYDLAGRQISTKDREVV